jgi:hypothetical protein
VAQSPPALTPGGPCRGAPRAGAQSFGAPALDLEQAANLGDHLGPDHGSGLSAPSAVAELARSRCGSKACTRIRRSSSDEGRRPCQKPGRQKTFVLNMPTDSPTAARVGNSDASLFAGLKPAPGTVAADASAASALSASPDNGDPPRGAIGGAPRCGTAQNSTDGHGRSASRCSCYARTRRIKNAGIPASALAPWPRWPGPENNQTVIIDVLGGAPSGPAAEAAAPGKSTAASVR